MLVAILLFGVPSAIIAHYKGFRPWWWLAAFGIIGLVVVICLSSAKARGISQEEAVTRAQKANGVSTLMGGICVGLVVIVFAIGVITIVATN